MGVTGRQNGATILLKVFWPDDEVRYSALVSQRDEHDGFRRNRARTNLSNVEVAQLSAKISAFDTHVHDADTRGKHRCGGRSGQSCPVSSKGGRKNRKSLVLERIYELANGRRRTPKVSARVCDAVEERIWVSCVKVRKKLIRR